MLFYAHKLQANAVLLFKGKQKLVGHVALLVVT